MKTLRKGATGTEVMQLQRALNRAGCDLTVDGIFGNDTYNAVLAYQATHGLTIDGVVGPNTWEKLNGKQVTNTQMYNALITCLVAIEALPEFKQLEKLLYGE